MRSYAALVALCGLLLVAPATAQEASPAAAAPAGPVAAETAATTPATTAVVPSIFTLLLHYSLPMSSLTCQTRVVRQRVSSKSSWSSLRALQSPQTLAHKIRAGVLLLRS